MYLIYLHAEFEKTLEIVGLSWWRLSGHLFGVSGNAVVLSASINSPILALMVLPEVLPEVLPDFVTSEIESFQCGFVFKLGYLISALVILVYLYGKKHPFQMIERGNSLSRGVFDDAS